MREGSESKWTVGIFGFIEAKKTREDHPLYVLDLSIFSAYTIILCILLQFLALSPGLYFNHNPFVGHEGKKVEVDRGRGVGRGGGGEYRYCLLGSRPLPHGQLMGS